MWKCPQQSQNVKSNFSLILFPSTERPFMKKKECTSDSKNWGNFNFLFLSSYFYLFVYFKESMPLFNIKLDAKFQLSILQFKVKNHEQRAGIFLFRQNRFSKSIPWKQHRDMALWCKVKGTLGNGTAQRKEVAEGRPYTVHILYLPVRCLWLKWFLNFSCCYFL